VAEETEFGLVLANLSQGLVFSAHSFIEETPTPLDSLIQEFRSPQVGIFASSKVASQEGIELQDETPAQQVILKGKDKDGVEVTLHLIHSVQEPRTYLIWLYGQTMIIDWQRVELQEMVESIALMPDQLYGLDRDQAIVLLGGEPEPEELDPARSMSGAADYVGLLYSGLVSLSPQLQVQPDLAERWTISPDGAVYTFTLRTDAAFQSGKPITAEDVRYSWERAVDPDTGSTSAGTYLGDIQGVQAVLDGEDGEIEGLKVIDDLTLQVTLDGPKPYFLAKLTYPVSYVVDKESVSASPEEWTLKPNASGPYGLREFTAEDSIIFERNPAYHTVAKTPYLVYLLYRSGSPLSLFEAGEIDLSYVSPAEVKSIQEPDHPLNAQLRSNTSMCTSFVFMDNTAAPMDDPLVRAAFAQAVDRERLIELFSEGLSLKADSILPPAMPGFSADLAPIAFDPKAAKAALAESKYAGELPTITMSVPGYADVEDEYTNALVDMWRKTLGAQIEVEYLDPRDIIKAAQEHHGQLLNYSWCADYPDPENFLDILFHTGGSFNAAGYSNPAVDDQLEEARVELDPDQRLDLYKQVEKLLLDDYAALPLMYPVQYLLVSPELKAYELLPMHGRILHLVEVERARP
jgi:oligopeptide transport system substrate-binding protein